MRKTVLDQIVRYFAACPEGKQVVNGEAIEKECPRLGRFDTATPVERVQRWAAMIGLEATPKDVHHGKASRYCFTKA